jgi:DNA polymerase V
MSELLILDMVEKHYVTDQIVLTIGYDISNLENTRIREEDDGEITIDYYGREVPKHAHGTIRLDHKTSSTNIMKEKVLELL